MRLLSWALGLLAVPLIAQHSITLNWKLPPANAQWTNACGSGPGYDCTFVIFCYPAGSPGTACPTSPSAPAAGIPTAPCSTNGSDYEMYAQSGTNATTYADLNVAVGDSRCYGVATQQNSLLSPMAFLNNTIAGSPTLPLAATLYTGETFYPILPCRMVDTRNANGSLGGPALAANTSRDFPLLSSNCGVPSTALSYVLNVTAIPTSNSSGNLIVWPTGSAMPTTSAVNWVNGTVVGNEMVVAAGVNGSVSVYSNAAGANVVIDCTGYFQ